MAHYLPQMGTQTAESGLQSPVMAPPISQPDEGLNAAVAAELRAEQGRQKLSVKQLAAKSGVSYGSLRRYLDGERHIDVAVLEALAKGLGRSAVEIVASASTRIPPKVDTAFNADLVIYHPEDQTLEVVEAKEAPRLAPGEFVLYVQQGGRTGWQIVDPAGREVRTVESQSEAVTEAETILRAAAATKIGTPDAIAEALTRGELKVDKLEAARGRKARTYPRPVDEAARDEDG